MKWILIGFVFAVLSVSVMLSAGFEFIGAERPAPTAETGSLTGR